MPNADPDPIMTEVSPEHGTVCPVPGCPELEQVGRAARLRRATACKERESEMDDKRFDLLAKSISSGRSRRSLLRSLAAAFGVAALGIDQASAAPPAGKPTKCYGEHSRCTNAKQCCSGICTNRTCAPAVPVDPCAGKNCDDGNECTTDSCSGGVCSHTPMPGAPCKDGTGTCDSSGVCRPGVACGPFMSCPPPPTSCHAHLCDVATSMCVIEVLPQGVSCDSGDGTCDGMGNCVYPTDPCAGVTCPPTGNECLRNDCGYEGQCYTKPFWGAPCNNGLGTCDEFTNCIENPTDRCAGVTCPLTENECIGYFCDSLDGVCYPKVLIGAPCEGGNGTCNEFAGCDTAAM